MRFSDLAGKELIDVREGLRLGELGDAELVFEMRTGKVRAIVVAPQGPWWRRSREMVIPWAGVRKIGVDVIVVDMAVGAEPSLAPPSGRGEGARRDRENGGTGAGNPVGGWDVNGDVQDSEGGGGGGGVGGGFWDGMRDGSAFFFRRR